MLDGLDRVNHADVLAHLEGSLGVVELDVLKTLLAEALEELHLELETALGDLDAVLEFLESEVLQEVAQVALVRIGRASPRVEIRVRL